MLTYEAKWHSTLRNDQRATSAGVLLEARRSKGQIARMGVEFSTFSRHYEGLARETVDIEPDLYLMRRRKDPDELRLLRKAIAATGKNVRNGSGDDSARGYGAGSVQRLAIGCRAGMWRDAHRHRE